MQVCFSAVTVCLCSIREKSPAADGIIAVQIWYKLITI